MVRQHRGFLSRTTNTYQFGILEGNQWVAEERLLRDRDEPAGYSVVTRTWVKGFTVCRKDAQRKFTREIMDFIQELAQQRYYWVRERAKELTQMSVKVAGMDPSETKYDESYAETTKRYSTAVPYAQKTISKMNLTQRSSPFFKAVPVIEAPALDPLTPREPKIAETKVPEKSGEKSGSKMKFNMTCAFPTNRSKNLLLTLPNRKGQESSLPSLANKQSFSLRPFDVSSSVNERSMPMAAAASATRILRLPSYTPFFSPKMSKELVASAPYRPRLRYVNKKAEEEKIVKQFKIEMKKKELSQFTVGKRIIRLVDDDLKNRPDTAYYCEFLSATTRSNAT
eukprot:TRINITY_DN7367_c0_g1_i11.p2 TRINITY_DN7367_c0_g1~~TRINITY_DN7367_c0_g1_i11.p2  ORF type:complete len:339 (-),score=78.60 TRINITY_DN7367_c0_g1_i11:176-1192(-)